MRWFLYGNAERYGNYLRAFSSAGATVCASLDISRAASCSGLLLPGGGDIHPRHYGQPCRGARGIDEVRDAAELALTATFAAVGKPILGICRGLQLLNVYFGGTLHQDIMGHAQQNGVDRVHSAYTDDALLCLLYGGRCLVNSAHHQSIDCLGAGLRAIEWADDDTIEAVRHETLPIFAVQWHPERTCSGMADGPLLLRALSAP